MTIEERLKAYIGSIIFELHACYVKMESLEAQLKAKIDPPNTITVSTAEEPSNQ